MILRRVFEGAYSLQYTETKVEANFHSPFVLGGEYKNCMFISKKGRLAGYYSKEEMDRLQLVSHALLMKKDFSSQLLSESHKVCNGIRQMTKMLIGGNLCSLSNNDLATRFDIFRKEHWLNHVYFFSSMPTCTALLERELKRFVSERARDSCERQQLISVLTRPASTNRTALSDEQDDYMQLVGKVLKGTPKSMAKVPFTVLYVVSKNETKSILN